MQTKHFSYDLLRMTKEMLCVCVPGHFGPHIFINIPLFTFVDTLLSLKYYELDTLS